MRSTTLSILAVLTLSFAACGGDAATTPDDGAIISADGGPDLSVGGSLDMTMGAPVGDPCTAKAQCSAPHATCLTASMFSAAGITLPGGYCSRTCTGSMDTTTCGDGASCINFGNNTFYCIKDCMAGTDCRTGYACRQFGCFSGDDLDCNPAMGTGACTTTDKNIYTAGLSGGCIRESDGTGGANGNAGVCTPTCDIGTGTCPADAQGNPYSCLIEDTALTLAGGATGDKWVGPICLNILDTGAVATNSECLYMGQHYTNVCVDGAECDLKGSSASRHTEPFSTDADNKCRQLCYHNGAPAGTMPDGGTAAGACPGGTTCQAVWFAFTTGGHEIGMCKP